jgi:hypothetical protein
MAKVGNCKLCGQSGLMAKAHIVPRAFYDFSGGLPFRVFSETLQRGSKRLPDGIWDDDLLCRECELSLSDVDGYAQQKLKRWPRRCDLIKDENGFIVRVGSHRAVGYTVKNIDAHKMLLFFCFLIWRFMETTQQGFAVSASIEIRSKFKDALLQLDAGALGISIIAARFRQHAATGVMRPAPQNWTGLGVLCFQFGGFEFHVRINAIAQPDSCAFEAGADWLIPFLDFEDSRFAQSIAKTVLRPPDPWAGLRRKRSRSAINQVSIREVA